VSHEVIVSPAAQREFGDLTRETQERVAGALRGMAEDPRPPGARCLSGRLRGLMRIRVGDWRVAYRVDDRACTVTIVEIAHRSRIHDRAQLRRPS